MIYLYSGTPGSGKSYHACKVIWNACKHGTNVIANFPVSFPSRYKLRGDLVYLTNYDMTVDWLAEYANEYHEQRKESQTVIVIDEAGAKFNARNWQEKGRSDWLDFFAQHRKLGFDVLMIAQNDGMIDKQIRNCIEVEVKHRKLSTFGLFGYLLKPFGTFACVSFYHASKTKLDSSLLRYSSKIASIYDTFAMFNETGELSNGRRITEYAGIVDDGNAGTTADGETGTDDY